MSCVNTSTPVAEKTAETVFDNFGEQSEEEEVVKPKTIKGPQVGNKGCENSNVPKNAVIISAHRSISLADFDAISGDFIEFMHNKNDRDIKLIELLKDKKPTHIFFIASENTQNKKIYNINFENCVGKLIKKTKNVKTSVTRNPFNNGNIIEQNLHLYEFDYKKLPACYQ